MTKPTELSPAPVPATDKPAGEAEARRERWSWSERSVWTDRMLAALEQGVKGGVWFSLIDKVWSKSNLSAGFARVRSNGGAAGIDHQTTSMFDNNLESNLQRLHG